MDPVTDAVFASLIAGIIIEEVKKLFSVTDKEIDIIYQTVLKTHENLKKYLGDKYVDLEDYDYPQSSFMKIMEFYEATASKNPAFSLPFGQPYYKYYSEFKMGREAGEDYYKEREEEYENETISDILKDVEKSRDKDVSDAYFDGYKEGIKEEKEKTEAGPGSFTKEWIENYLRNRDYGLDPFGLSDSSSIYNKESLKGSPEESVDIFKAYAEIIDRLSSKDYTGAMASLTSFVERVSDLNKGAPAGGGLGEVTAALVQLAEIGGKVLPALAVLNGKSPEAVAREMGGAGVAGKTAEPGGRSVTEGDVIAIALAVAEKIMGEAGQGITGSGGEAAGRGQRDEEGHTLSVADIAAVRAVVVDSFAQAGQPNGQPAIGATDIAQTASANHEQLIQLLSAIKGGEDQIFLYQQLAYSDQVAIRNQLKEMGCDPISNMYDHSNMKI
jgi:hypothetical protein